MKHLKTFESHDKKVDVPYVTDSLQYFIDDLSLELKYYNLTSGEEVPNNAIQIYGNSGLYYVRYSMLSSDPIVVNKLTLVTEFKRAMSKLSMYRIGLTTEFDNRRKDKNPSTHSFLFRNIKDIMDYLSDIEGDEVGVYDLNFTISL